MDSYDQPKISPKEVATDPAAVPISEYLNSGASVCRNAFVTLHLRAVRWQMRVHPSLPRLYSTMAETLVPLPAVEKLSDRVIRVLGGNPSKVSLFARIEGFDAQS